MAAQPLPRRVHLVVVSTRYTPEELSDRLNMQPDAAVPAREPNQGSASGRLAKENTWELRVGGPSSSDINVLLESLYGRLLHITERLKALSSEGCQVILRIILYLSPTDEHGAGFAMSGSLIKWLDVVGIEFVDVEQYII